MKSANLIKTLPNYPVNRRILVELVPGCIDYLPQYALRVHFHCLSAPTIAAGD